jgi:ABC-type uncharacterized transport system permease subunit
MTTLLVSAITATTPLLLAALGGVVAGRAGLFSIGLEAYMLVGAFVAVLASDAGGAWPGFFAAMVGGMLVAAIFGFLSINLRVNQIVAGLTLNILALGVTGFFFQVAYGITASRHKVPGFDAIEIPLFSEIPMVGRALFAQNIFWYVALAVLVGVTLFFRRTHAGLALHAVGEFPQAADSRGISVARTRWAAALFSGAVAGLGGAMLTIGQIDTFVNDVTSGRGYIALAAVIFAGWRPLGAAAACLLIGLADAGQVWANVLGIDIPFQFLAMLPYVLTIVALVMLRRMATMPAALGLPYSREER